MVVRLVMPAMGTVRALIAQSVVLSVALGLGGGCRQAPTEVVVDTVEAGPTVSSDVARQGTVRRWVRGATTLNPAQSVPVVTSGMGHISALHFDVGDAVEAGALMAEVSNDQSRLAQDDAQARAAGLRAEVDRLRPLYTQGFVARQRFDEAQRAYDDARRAVERARGESSLLQIEAPIGGIVTERAVESGQTVSPNQLLFRVEAPQILVADLQVPERSLRWLREGQEAEVVVESVRDEPFAGTVTRIAPRVDAATATADVRITLQLAAGERAPLPGMFAEVGVLTESHHDAVLVEARAVLREADGTFVIAVDREAPEGPLARRLPVTLGLTEGEAIELVDGLAAGDEIVVVGQSDLVDGARISPVRVGVDNVD